MAMMSGEMFSEQPGVEPAEGGAVLRRLTPPLDPWVEAVRDLRERLVAAGEPFREEFLALLAAAGGRSFGESNPTAAAEVNAVLGLLGLQFRDPDRPDRAAYLRHKQAPGTRSGAFELRGQGGGRQRVLYSRTAFPARVEVGDALRLGPGEGSDLSLSRLPPLPDGNDPAVLRSADPAADAASAG